MLKRSLTIITAGALFAGLSASAVTIYEGFDYSAGLLNGNGGDNWGGAWNPGTDGAANDDEFFVKTPGLTYSGLTTIGGLAERGDTTNRGWAVRTIDSAAQTTLTGGSEMWFSFLYNSGGGEDFAFLFGNFVDLTGGGDPTLADGTGSATAGDAFGFSSINNSFAATVFENAQTGSLGTGSGSSQDLVNEDSVFIVGKITWGATDTLELFNPGNTTTAEGDLVAFSTATGSLDESSFDTIGLWDRPNSFPEIDEIRLASTYDEVRAVVVPEPSAFALLAGFLGLAWVMLRRRS